MSTESTTPQENRVAELDDQSQTDLNRVLGTALGVAREQLEGQGVFLPFAIGLEPASGESIDGELRLLAIQPTEDEEDPEADIDTEVMMTELVELLTGQRDQLVAIAFVSDVTLLEEDSDAIHAMAEHSLGSAVAVVQTYAAPVDEDGEWSFGDPEAEAGDLQVWAS
ncbi:hypothetical protein [Paeniglutamicibacter cryotolerans]|uniref:Uncharacterized protein n=1 Tax=Paeniglutamicibacter cryotolerans TaxID=670079 RepID=A0A839QKN3_9MICC|nr:hypothetical protein [Paeniglutamicibacter cryotolerans]MBB2995324.1 hypothetical protein [Paeniglutamicibacter cryotolerans]